LVVNGELVGVKNLAVGQGSTPWPAACGGGARRLSEPGGPADSKDWIMAKLLLAVVCTATWVTAQPAQEYYKPLVDKGNVTGAYFAEVADGEVVQTASFGKALPGSLWRAASTSKTLTAVGIMRWSTEGNLR